MSFIEDPPIRRWDNKVRKVRRKFFRQDETPIVLWKPSGVSVL